MNGEPAARAFPVLTCASPTRELRERTPRSVPWTMLAPHEERALRNHGQTLERLAQRCGLDPLELCCVLEDRDVLGPRALRLSYQDALDRLAAHVAQHEAGA